MRPAVTNRSRARGAMHKGSQGRHSRAVITGDVTQVDLMGGATSGLVQIEHILEGLRDVAFVRLSKTDVVRHRLVRDIIHAYEEYEQRG